jgi:uncharacterized repeat protein (TIGR03803 family)
MRKLHLIAGFAAAYAAFMMPQAKAADVSERILYSFCSQPSCSDGANPYAGLIADRAGHLYGTTFNGGASGLGVVFELLPGGRQRVLHSFTGPDGAHPYAGLIGDSSGNLYGTAAQGGTSGLGVVFKLSPGGAYTVLHSFAGSDGANPYAGLIAVSGSSGAALYGTAYNGGASGRGVVFKLSPDGSGYKVLHSFAGGATDGAYPQASLTVAGSSLYGTTYLGGTCGAGQCGVAFKVSPDGSTYQVLHVFTGVSDGAYPEAGLIADKDGNLYGTALSGGSGCAWEFIGCGTVFKISPNGSAAGLYSFCIDGFLCSDGAMPVAGVIAGKDGNLYGTTFTGGSKSHGDAPGSGVVFKLSPNGTEAVLYAFSGGSDGALPFAGLIALRGGRLLGTTVSGGRSGNGAVFELLGTGIRPGQIR